MRTVKDDEITVEDVARQFKPTVVEAIALAAAEIGAVGKDAKMEAGPARYAYRSIDGLLDAAHGPLCKHGVVFVPGDIQIVDRLEKTTKSGAVQYHIRCLIGYTIYGPNGDHIQAQVLAEATDTGDKCLAKVMSIGFKYVLGQVLSLPFTMDDQDATLSEPVAPVRHTHPLTRLEELAAQMGRSVEEISAKYRQANGDLDMAAFRALPPEKVQPLVQQIEQFLKART